MYDFHPLSVIKNVNIEDNIGNTLFLFDSIEIVLRRQSLYPPLSKIRTMKLKNSLTDFYNLLLSSSNFEMQTRNKVSVSPS